MQFSFPALPNVSAPTASGAPAGSGVGAPAVAPDGPGFADVLAGATTPPPGTVGAAVPGAAGVQPANPVPTVLAPGVAAAVETGLAAANLGLVPAQSGEAPDVTSPGSESAGDTDAGVSTKGAAEGDAVRKGDLLSMMMALWSAPPAPVPTPSPAAAGGLVAGTGDATTGGGAAGLVQLAVGSTIGGKSGTAAPANGFAAVFDASRLTSGTPTTGAAVSLPVQGNPATNPVPPVVTPNGVGGAAPAVAPTSTPTPVSTATASATTSTTAALPLPQSTSPAPAPSIPAKADVAPSSAATIAALPAPGGSANLSPGLAAAAVAAAAQTATPRAPAGRMEKFAAPVTAVSSARKSDGIANIKSSLTSDGQKVSPESPSVGIDAAKTPATMPAGSTLERPSPSDTAAVLAPHAISDAKADAGLPASVALPSTAHRAVEAVLSATERFAAREQSSVTLRFNVGNNDLNVRVEMRAGEVHTTFRTDSPELRAALSAEWQSATSGGDRGARLAPPVFASSDQHGMSSSGEGASRHRDQPAQQPSPGFTFTSSRSNGSSSAPTSGVAVTAAPPAGRPATSRHLQTLA